jgi:hypothetical protein
MCRGRVAEEMRRRTGTLTADHDKPGSPVKADLLIAKKEKTYTAALLRLYSRPLLCRRRIGTGRIGSHGLRDDGWR